MRTIELVTIDEKTIYQGTHHSLNEAIESAITKNISLDGIDLSNTILHHINLDGVSLRNAYFRGADLTGANMSEANFTDCDFSFSTLDNACLCYSNINRCNFRSSILKGTDISMISIENSNFEGFSALTLPLHTAFHICGLTYHHFGKTHSLDTPPTLIRSADKLIAVIGNAVIFKDLPYTFEYKNDFQLHADSIPVKIQSMIDFAKSRASS